MAGVLIEQGPVYKQSQAAHTWGENAIMNKKPADFIWQIEVNNVFYLYAIGHDFIAISTRPDGQWGTIPEHAQVCFAFSRPDINYSQNPLSPGSEMEMFVRQAIRNRIEQQRKGIIPCPLGLQTVNRPRKSKLEPHSELIAKKQ